MMGSSVSSWLNVFSAFTKRKTNACFEKERLSISRITLELFQRKTVALGRNYFVFSLSVRRFGV